MVFINDKKFACEACIKGHRSSSCGHSDRPLYEIKKKGRPVSQCMNCREARSKKKVHSKCTCAEVKPARAEKAFGTKQKRYMPLEPTLPNGLADAMAKRRPSKNDTPANPRQRVDSLLNPCSCLDVWTCTCDKRPSASASTSATHTALSAGSSGLDALAQAAAELFGTNQDGRALEQAPVQSSETQAEPRPRKHCCSPRGSPAPAKRAKTQSSPTPGPDLPPLLFSSATLPDFPTTSEMPSFSKLETIAGSGCSCGVNCSCPGCAEHDRSDSSAERCGDSCGNCVDPSTGVLPGDAASAGESSVSRSAVFEKMFFKHAALLPPPPIPGGRPVELPKLCCGGSCGCGGECGCGSACGGCCAEKEDEEVESFSPPPPVTVKKSCCSS
ncbi:copper-fist-domain-containing protein [Peniophora sp. CONT]|nr:copper-fist-domain-containing protein [Peniophora sp. CONT]